MKRIIGYITDARWAVFVTTLSTLLLNLPAIIEAGQGQIDDAGGKIEPLSLIVFLAGFVIQRKMWSSREVSSIEQDRKVEMQSLALAKQEQDLRLLDLAARELAASAVIDAARKGLPLPVVDFPQQAQKASELP